MYSILYNIQKYEITFQLIDKIRQDKRKFTWLMESKDKPQLLTSTIKCLHVTPLSINKFNLFSN